jgi:RNA polymerase subunit RPABC4/transcription elongation factor Spt4
MNCHRCGNILSTNSSSCPHCDRPPPRTKKLSEADINKTRAIVQVERCENCGFLMYAGDKECQACGTWSAWQNPAAATRPRMSHDGKIDKKRMLAGIILSILLLSVLVIVWHFVLRPQQP